MSRSVTEIADLGPVALDGFEVWDRTTEAPAGKAVKRAFVTISPVGTIAPNVYSRAMLDAEAVKIMYDKDRGRLGFVPADPDAANGFLWPTRFCAGQLATRRFCDHHGIAVAETTRYYDLELIDGVLIANLGGPPAG